MKLDFQNIEIERSSSFKTQHFDIGDKRIIMEILRGKMYSNPIQTICQEVTSNARDAHHEVGKDLTPIEIKLPNKLDPSFWIRDFGPGITPERMSDVFIKYGNSTKRNDDKLIGGFGLGAKSPYSYTDTFTVISITPEDNKLLRREYLAHIDETGIGQMSCVKEEVTSDPQGTTVVIYPKQSDWNEFTRYVKRGTAHWSVRPNVVGDPNFVWPEHKIAYKGNDWEIHDNSSLEHIPYALIEGIPYGLNLRHLYPGGHPLIANIPIRLLFKIGEIPVTANREEIDYQSHVITYIKNRIDRAVKEFQDQLTKNLAEAETLRAAIIIWQDLRNKSYRDFLTQTSWKGIVLRDYQTIRLESHDCHISHFRRAGHVTFGCRKTGISKTLHIDKNSLIIEDDLKSRGIQKARLATIFDHYPEINSISVIDFTKKYETVVDAAGISTKIITIVDDSTIDSRKKAVEIATHYSSLEPIKLSSFPKKKIIIEDENENKKKRKIVKARKFNIISENNYDWEEIDSQILKDNKPKLYVVIANRAIVWHTDAKPKYEKIQTRNLYDIILAINKMRKAINPKDIDPITIYGILPSLAANLENNCQPFYKYAETVVNAFQKILPNQFGSEYAASRRFSAYAGNLLNNTKFIDSLEDNNLLKQYVLASNRVNDAATLIGIHNDIAPYFKKDHIIMKADNQKELKKYYDQINLKYPLLLALNNFYSNTRSIKDIDEDISLYIRVKDQQEVEKQQKIETESKQANNSQPGQVPSV